MTKRLLSAIGPVVHALIKSIEILTFSLVTLISFAQDESKVMEFKKIATEVNCILEKPQRVDTPFLLKVMTRTSSIELNENSFLSNFMITCDFYSDKNLIPIKSMTFGNFSTSNFKPKFIKCSTDSKSMVSIPLKFITIYMFDYIKENQLEIDFKKIDKVCVSLIIKNLTPSASKDGVAFLTNEVSFSKDEFLLFIASAKAYDKKLAPNENLNQIYK